MFVEIEIADLKVGMYLVEIIKPKDKFQLLDSGLIKKAKTIISLQQKGVEIVLIDPERAQIPAEKTVPSESKQSFKEAIVKAKAVFDESKNIQKKLFQVS
ncbi:DUF3391 domain-containing protein [Psychromonas sp. KJ10-10]|uniref:DUF3391 domain-containing protein n=1 Tax=Psychromonas sp. KJ10-10 TaxID=3391823 RepID=UPI0039B50B28